MLKKSITYVDYDGVTRTEDFYFNLNQVEALGFIKDENNDDLEKVIRKIIAEKDTNKILSMMKNVILTAYGEKSIDGKRFMKKDIDGHPLSQKFEETEAFVALYMEFMEDSSKFAAFLNGIVPPKLAQTMAEQNADNVLPIQPGN